MLRYSVVVLTLWTVVGVGWAIEASECGALYSLYTFTSGAQWIHRNGWEDANLRDCCSWFGVTCDPQQAHVTEIVLPGNGLDGSIPPSLSSLTALRVLKLGDALSGIGNNVSGALSEDWGNWTSLETLDLSYNEFYGSLPLSWRSWLNISGVFLGENLITGTLPSEWNLWVGSVQSVVLRGNELKGTLPWEWLTWFGASTLDISGNGLVGTLPSRWSMMRNLSTLDLSNNEFSGSIPSEWALLSRMKEFRADSNELSGTLPLQLSEWTELESFSISANNIGGSLPPAYARWRNIRTFEAYSNKISGDFPTDYETWTGLRYFQVAYNPIRGTLPSAWSAWSSIITFNADLCFIGGTLPASWRAWTSLSGLYLVDNSITGELPSVWGEMSNLTEIVLDGNALIGTIPAAWGALSQLELFSAPFNDLQGPLPSAWQSCEKMEVFTVAGNYINGTLPAEWSAWRELTRFDVSENAITRSIPDEWNDGWRSIIAIDVSYNFLSGNISTRMPSLSTLHVESNNFEGVDTAALEQTHVVTLSLRWNPISVLPVALAGSKFFTVLDMRDTMLRLALGDIPLASPNIPVLWVANNRAVTGEIGELIRAVGGSASISSYIDLNLSNTSISGPVDVVDPAEFEALNVNRFFPLLNVRTMSIANNDGIFGPLPISWFGYNSAHGQPLTLNVTSCPNLRHSLEVNRRYGCEELTTLNLPFDCRAPRLSYGDDSYVCRPLVWPNGIRVIGLNASYFDYQTCGCAPGYSGTVPHCKLSDDNSVLVGLLVSFGIALVVALVLGGRWVVNWRRFLMDVRLAKAILAQSADRYGISIYAPAGSGNGTSGASGSGSTSLTTALLLERQQRQPSGIDRDWIVRYDDVHIVETVARGSQGKVSMALWNRTRVALKEFNTTSDAEKEILLSEALLHVRLRHPNIVQLLGVCIDPVCTLTEWMDRGSLFNVLHNSPERIASIYDVARDIARGMLYLHRQGVVHRDLKSLNVMLDSRGTAKVGDFGLARKWNEGESATMTMCQGTPHWMAPEVFRGDGYDSKCDVYSFGIILWELVTKQMPFPEMQFGREVEEYVSGGGRPAVSECIGHSELVGLMQRCWSGDAVQRPTFDAIVDELEGMGS